MHACVCVCVDREERWGIAMAQKETGVPLPRIKPEKTLSQERSGWGSHIVKQFFFFFSSLFWESGGEGVSHLQPLEFPRLGVVESKL